ncbi:MAG: tetratricopeptide (TPR) repeat protein [Bacteroidia bacterium]|jgi:tetratricopeptide (TPR) repeat protein
MVYQKKISISKKFKSIKKVKMKAVKNIILTILISLTATFALGQDNWEGHLYGADTIAAQKSDAMFNQYYTAKNYIDAYPYWQYLFNNAPCASKRITYNGSFVAKKYLFHLMKTDSAAFAQRKDGLIDTILMVYDTRVKHWGKADIVMAKKAKEMYSLRPDLRDSAIGLFEESVRNLGNNTEVRTPLFYMQSAIKEHKAGKYSIDSLFDLYFQLQGIIDYNLAQGGKYKSKWISTDTNVTKMIRPYLTCEKIEEFFKPKTDSIPDDLETLKKVTNLLAVAKCNKSDYALDIAIKVYELEPSSEAAISIGNSYKAKSMKTEALEWYVKGVDGIQDTTEKADILQNMSSIEYANGNIASATTYAKRVLAINPNSGAAHLIVAGSYANSVGSCKADGIDGLSAYWAAVDRAVKAKTVDPSVVEQANKFINVYSAYFVKSEQAFFKNFALPAGGTFVVPCLGVSTIVRFNK